ncbi:hypothetical protein BGZ61DRAFT_167143 [Ilyonectria robusta]|uniref:uncharacterized protein n=1 Tax=Ilyonectria robusta TaxID=1079257 RepID=UPI001E8D038F|nr:uncharacterized protein BGZ61DRAFT_167143 [Ilyonectria robusta]KAH8733873.1 hypothetical protein BGZ61DRAFT_167143 [Ilyonectria robusta]
MLVDRQGRPKYLSPFVVAPQVTSRSTPTDPTRTSTALSHRPHSVAAKEERTGIESYFPDMEHVIHRGTKRSFSEVEEVSLNETLPTSKDIKRSVSGARKGSGEDGLVKENPVEEEGVHELHKPPQKQTFPEANVPSETQSFPEAGGFPSATNSPIPARPSQNKASRTEKQSTADGDSSEEAQPAKQQPNLREKSSCERCGRLFPHDETARKHEKTCKGRCKSCRDNNLACTKSAKADSCQCCLRNGLDCTEFSHADAPCERCGGPLPKRGPEHIKKCKGRCKHCQDADVPYLKNGNRVKRCERCIKNGLECSDFSHTPTLPAKTAVKVPCERCGQFMWPWNLKNHLPQCKGKCSECMKGNAPCLFRPGKRCERCSKRKLECGSFSHEHLAENKYICSRCDNAYGSALTLSQHVAQCRGKCDQCKDSNIPCVWIGTSSACSSCIDKEIQCTGIETAGAPSATEVPCPHCLSLIPQKKIATHEKRCRGRCYHCIEPDVPCEHSQGGAHICSQCRQDAVECVFK